jgi:hypothetical protein
LRVIIILTAPVWLPVALVALLTELAFLPGELGLRRRMRRTGRVTRAADMRYALAADHGSLIVEWPTPGWRFCRL